MTSESYHDIVCLEMLAYGCRRAAYGHKTTPRRPHVVDILSAFRYYSGVTTRKATVNVRGYPAVKGQIMEIGGHPAFDYCNRF